MTRGELVLSLRGLRTAERNRRDLALWHAWHVAALTRIRKRLPSLRSLLGGEAKPPTPAAFNKAREAHGDITDRLGKS